MRRPAYPALALALALGCGGGGGSGLTVEGRLTVVTGAPLLAAPSADREPNDFAACARLARGPLAGRVDARTDPVDVLRTVADAAGPLRAVLEAKGFRGEVILHDLARGRAAETLDVEAGAVLDVVVVAREGAGTYTVRLVAEEGDRTPRALPPGYRHCGEGHADGEIVAAPAAGLGAAELAARAGLRCLAGTDGLCLLGAPPADRAGEFERLCDLLCRCARLEAEGLVRYAQPNFRRRLAGASPDDPLFPAQWPLEQIRAPAAWQIVKETTLVLAYVDSGVREHPDLVANLVDGWDFEEDDDDPRDPTFSFSHGTQVAGILAAATNNGEGIAGVFWRAKIMPVRAFDSAGFGTTFDISNAILFAAGEPNESMTLPDEAATAINLSFASSIPTVPEEEACDAARAKGIFVAAAAGNAGTSTVRYPAGYASVIGVAATGRDGGVTSYSNFGSWIDIAAPGGTPGDGVPTTGIGTGGQFTYPRVNGTSFACPHVVAVAAMCRTLAPLSVDEVEQALFTTATDLGDPGKDIRSGHGLLNAYRALLAALQQPPPPLFPFEEVEVRLVQLPSLSVLMSLTTTEAESLVFRFAGVPAGRYRLEAGTDRDFDGSIDDPGEVFGRWEDGEGGDELVLPGAGAPVDFTIAPR